MWALDEIHRASVYCTNRLEGYHRLLHTARNCYTTLTVAFSRVDWTGVAATELPPRVHLGLELAGPLCAAI
jgi:hypothetical protein